jgi:uncharacterized SAM-binding protein YcdF (DUF218 family)
LTRGVWDQPEADRFAEIAVRMGVPREAILIENRSTNTGENVQFTKNLLAKLQLDPQKLIQLGYTHNLIKEDPAPG